MITIISGQPRSGTTLMMRMLHQGGMDVYADTYTGYESEAVINIANDNVFLHDCVGKAVKILHPYILHLPHKIPCKIIWMHRNPKEQAKSQKKFLRELDVPKQWVDHTMKKHGKPNINRIRRNHKDMLKLFKGIENVKVLKVAYEDLKEFPGDAVMDVELFLKIDLDTVKMIDCLENRETKSQPDLSLEMGIATALDQPDTARSIRG